MKYATVQLNLSLPAVDWGVGSRKTTSAAWGAQALGRSWFASSFSGSDTDSAPPAIKETLIKGLGLMNRIAGCIYYFES